MKILIPSNPNEIKHLQLVNDDDYKRAAAAWRSLESDADKSKRNQIVTIDNTSNTIIKVLKR